MRVPKAPPWSFVFLFGAVYNIGYAFLGDPDGDPYGVTLPGGLVCLLVAACLYGWECRRPRNDAPAKHTLWQELFEVELTPHERMQRWIVVTRIGVCVMLLGLYIVWKSVT